MNNWNNKTNEELALEWQKTKDNDLFEYIYDKNKGLIFKYINKVLKVSDTPKDELYQAGRIALWKALIYFNNTSKLSSYYHFHFLIQLERVIKEQYVVEFPHYIASDIAKSKKLYTTLNMLSLETITENETLRVFDDFDIEADLRKEELTNYINSLIKDLSVKEILCLKKRFGLDDGQARSFEEVGKALNMSKQGANVIVNKALNKLREKTKNDRELFD